IAGMIILTVACPECRQAATMQYPGNRAYYMYDSNGDPVFVGESLNAADTARAGIPVEQRWF
ncbi:MAG: hypothetical protein NTX06_10190, partial [Proteobacteria bacterium]|nr:hypothetical protein [Pseudomonadota bacterium]